MFTGRLADVSVRNEGKGEQLHSLVGESSTSLSNTQEEPPSDDNRGRYSYKPAFVQAASCAGFDLWRRTCNTKGSDLILYN